jgi:uncharacterized protein (TIGR03437 family)
LDSSGQGAGAILDATYRVVSQTNPARAGDVILLYATGGGVTIPPSVDGQITLVPPYPASTAPVFAKIGGVDCPVQYSGGAYGLVSGALQINMQVAKGVPSGQQSISVNIGNSAHQSGVTVWVK